MSDEIKDLKNKFDAITVVDEDNKIEFWYARDLMKELGYISWEKFHSVIKKAMKSCETTGYDVLDHFHGAVKMVQIGSKAKRKINDYKLTRYACYLIAQNGDPRKKERAFAQSYHKTSMKEVLMIKGLVEYAQKVMLLYLVEIQQLI
jgi:DNA-damage-inducible protein D